MTDSRTVTVLRKLIVDTVNADPHRPWGHLDDEMAEQITVAVLAQFEGLAAGEVTTEWGVRYPDSSSDTVEVTSEYALPDDEYDSVDRFPDEIAARAEVQDYADEVPVLVSRRVGPWTEVSS